MNPLLKFAVEAGPLIVFFIGNARFGIFAGTAAFMVAIVIAVAVSWTMERKVPTVPLFSAVIVLIFGGLTLWLADETFIKLKPTILNAAFAAALFGGLAARKYLLKPLFGTAFQIDEEGWRILTWRWAMFFVAMAAFNEIVWRSVSTDTWVSVKLFVYLPLTFVFAIAQTPLIMRRALPEENSE